MRQKKYLQMVHMSNRLEEFIKRNWAVLLVAIMIAIFVWVYVLPQMDAQSDGDDSGRETLADIDGGIADEDGKEDLEEPSVEIAMLDQTDMALDNRSLDSLGSLADLYSLKSIDTRSTQIGKVEGASENIAFLATEQFSPYRH